MVDAERLKELKKARDEAFGEWFRSDARKDEALLLLDTERRIVAYGGGPSVEEAEDEYRIASDACTEAKRLFDEADDAYLSAMSAE